MCTYAPLPSPPPLPAAVHDPEVDTAVSPFLVQYGFYGSPSKHLFMLSGGYSSGTPLQWNDSVVLLAAAKAARSPYDDMVTMQAAARLPPVSPEVKLQSACSRERPVVIDVGGGLGTTAVMAGEAAPWGVVVVVVGGSVEMC